MWLIVHQNYLMLSAATLSNEIDWCSVLIKNHSVCVPTITVKWFLSLNRRNRKIVGGNHNVLIHYLKVYAPDSTSVVFCNPFKWDGNHNILVNYAEVCAPDSTSVVLCNPFKWDIVWFILTKNHTVCVPTTLAKHILFLNHMNRKVVRGNHNVLIHNAEVYAPDSKSVFLCNPFKWDISWFILIKNHVTFVPTTLGKRILFCNHSNKKVVGGMHNVLVHFMDVCAPDSSDIVLCNPFKWDI